MTRFLIATMLCCLATADAAEAKIVLKKVPKFGTTNASISGRVSGVSSSDYKAAVFIGLDQASYSKPTYAQPDTPLLKNGSFTCNITTGPNDPFAQKIVVFVAPEKFCICACHGCRGIRERANTSP